MHFYGFLCIPMYFYVFLRIPMYSYVFQWNPIVCVCIPMHSYSTPMDSYGFLWTPMDSYGFLWIPMDSFGVLLDSYWIRLKMGWISMELVALQSRITPA